MEENTGVRSELALAPPIFRRLWTVWKDAPPADPIARSILKVDFHYPESSAAEVLTLYKENLEFAQLRADQAHSERADDEPATAQSSDRGWGQSADRPNQPHGTQPARQFGKVPIMQGERVLSDGILSGSANYRVIVSGPIGLKEIERLIRKLEIDKEIMAEVEAERAVQTGSEEEE